MKTYTYIVTVKMTNGRTRKWRVKATHQHEATAIMDRRLAGRADWIKMKAARMRQKKR